MWESPSDRPAKRSAADPSGVWDVAAGTRSERELVSLDGTEVMDDSRIKKALGVE